MKQSILILLVAGLAAVPAAVAAEPELVTSATLDLGEIARVTVRHPDEKESPVPFRTDRRRRGWVVRLDDGVRSREAPPDAVLPSTPSPAVVEGRVIVGGGFQSRALTALSAVTGQTLWKINLNDNGASAAATTPRSVVVNTESCTTYTVDPRRGAITWSRLVGPNIAGAPTITGDRVVTAHRLKEEGWALTALRLRDGEILWSAPLPRDIVGAPVCTKDRAFITLETREVRCYDLRGKLLWMKDLEATSAPWMARGGLYLAATARRTLDVLCVNPANGAVFWRTKAPTRPTRTRRAGGTTVSRDELLPQRRRPHGWGDDPPRPVVVGFRVFIAGGRDLLVHSAATGELLANRELPAGHTFYAPPAVLGDRLLYPTEEGLLVEIRAKDLRVLRTVNLGVPLLSQPVVSKGRVFVTSEDLVISVPWGELDGPSWPQWGGTATHVTE